MRPLELYDSGHLLGGYNPRPDEGYKQQLLQAPAGIVRLTFQLYPSEIPGKASNQFLDKLQP
jgi:hypothetical protein